LFEHEQPRARDLARKCLAIADRKEQVVTAVHHERRYRELGQALAPARRAVELGEHHAQLVGHPDGGLRARCAVEDALGPRACRGGVVAEDLRARGGVLRHGGAVGPVGRREREPPAHRRRVVVGQVVVDRARCDGPGSGEGEGGERVRVVERGDLGDHPADPDARQVRGPVVESAGERGGIGGEIPQRIPRRLGVDGRRRAGVAQVVAHDVTSAASERLAQLIGPGKHGRAAHEQHEGRRRIAEVLDPERDTAGRAERVDRRMRRVHHQPPGQLRDRTHATRETSPAASAPAPTQGTGQSAVRSRDQSLRLRRLQLANGTPPSGCRAITHLHRRPPAVEVSDQVDTDYDANVPCAR